MSFFRASLAGLVAARTRKTYCVCVCVYVFVALICLCPSTFAARKEEREPVQNASSDADDRPTVKRAEGSPPQLLSYMIRIRSIVKSKDASSFLEGSYVVLEISNPLLPEGIDEKKAYIDRLEEFSCTHSRCLRIQLASKNTPNRFVDSGGNIRNLPSEVGEFSEITQIRPYQYDVEVTYQCCRFDGEESKESCTKGLSGEQS
eukprot:TRINITY_DN5417_c1_g4_i1.p1 TRINITY_DN5417_c1_g4~~TRINITY_DN5417_c1_g4_i1.p1  ORF type:complete len:203 (+),score=5.41 TRINITY_DN5417_c1_g4_i1:95-703(+)